MISGIWIYIINLFFNIIIISLLCNIVFCVLRIFEKYKNNVSYYHVIYDV